nr:MAG TPA: hypothetical protein [Caudoviricetes sp.]
MTYSDIRDNIVLGKQIYQPNYNINTSRKHLNFLIFSHSWKPPRSEGEVL